MVYIADIETDRRFTPDEYVDFAERQIDFDDFDALTETSWSLRALANDRDFLIDLYHGELKDLHDSKSGNILTPQSVSVVRREKFFVRANVWLTPAADPRQRRSEQTLYAYELPHDHNFHFVTVGYFGPGYETDLYSYDVAKTTGYVGERVDMVAHGRETLGPGRVMVYKANTDIHIQYEPSEISVSLNMIPLGNHIFARPQYVFDVDRRMISAGVSDQVGSRLFLLDFFRYMHDENSVDLLRAVSISHPCARTRGQALHVLEEIAPGERDLFRRGVDRDTLHYCRPNLVHAGYARQREG